MIKKCSLTIGLMFVASIGTIQAQNIFPTTGNAGIGTLIPAQDLHILNVMPFSAASAQSAIRLQGTNNFLNQTGIYDIVGQSDGDFFINYNDGTSAVSRLWIDNTGRLGLGTSTPTARLDVYTPNNTNFRMASVDGVFEVGLAGCPGCFSGLADEGDAVLRVLGGTGTQKMIFSTAAPIGTGRSFVFEAGATDIMTISDNGNVGIGVDAPANRLEVCGLIRSTEVVVETMWCDYVFEDDYVLRELGEVEAFIEENGHLPEIPSAKEVEENGVKLGEVHAKLLLKIEELTLYMIAAEKRMDGLSDENELLKEKLSSLESNQQ